MNDATATPTCPRCGAAVEPDKDACYCTDCGLKLRDTPLETVVKRFFADVKGFASIPMAGITPAMVDDYREQFAEAGLDVDAPVLA